MGLHPNWKPLLRETYPEAFIQELPAATASTGGDAAGDPQQHCNDVLLIDFLPMIFSKSKNIKTGEHFVRWIFKLIRSFFDKGGHTCVILIDTGKKVPFAKAPTQMERDKYTKPLSKDELAKDLKTDGNVIGPGLLHHEWYRLMANRELRAEIFRYFEEEFLHSFFANVKKKTWAEWRGHRNRSRGESSLGKGSEEKGIAFKNIIVDGGQQYRGVPYIIRSYGEVEVRKDWETFIGESDLKIPFYINHVFLQENVLVYSIDSDLIRILLLHTRLRVDESTGQPATKVYLRLNDSKKLVPKENGSSSPTLNGDKEDQKEENASESDEGKENETEEKEAEREKNRTKKRQPKRSATKKDKEKEVGEDEDVLAKNEQETKAAAKMTKEELEQNFDTIFCQDIIDINKLWSGIIADWQMACPEFLDPIPSVVLLMILGGDDFVKNLPNCGAKLLYQVYMENIAAIGFPLVTVENFGVGTVAHVTLNSDALRLLVRYVYKKKLKVAITKDKGKTYTDLPSYEELRVYSLGYKKQALHCIPEEQVEAKFRRCRWTLLYTLNGPNPGLTVPDCIAMNPEDGLSLHGWELKDPKAPKTRKNIQRAVKISPELSYTLPIKPTFSLPPPPIPWSQQMPSLKDALLFSLPLLLAASSGLISYLRSRQK
ncbi:DUF3854 domain-containing protein [Balamuthia mandrillaris]